MTLYSFFRSSAAYRVRSALALKGIAFDIKPVHLSRGGGEQHSCEFRTVNPQGRVPALMLPNGDVLTQSLAIIDYLEQVHPEPALMPRDAIARARVNAAAMLIACDIHPLNNTSSLNYLRGELGQAENAIAAWYGFWIRQGFCALETMVRPGPYAFGAQPTLADICLVPQVYNARRFKVPLDDFPQLVAIDAACQALPAFAKAQPERQPDAE